MTRLTLIAALAIALVGFATPAAAQPVTACRRYLNWCGRVSGRVDGGGPRP